MKLTKLNREFDFSDTELIEALKERLDIRQFYYVADHGLQNSTIKELYNRLQNLQEEWDKIFS